MSGDQITVKVRMGCTMQDENGGNVPEGGQAIVSREYYPKIAYLTEHVPELDDPPPDHGEGKKK